MFLVLFFQRNCLFVELGTLGKTNIYARLNFMVGQAKMSCRVKNVD